VAGAAAAIEAAEAAGAAAPKATAAAAPNPIPAAAPARASTLDKPFIQIGIFSVEENARNTATAMRQAGMVPTVLEQNSQGKAFWRVIVGPATNTSERSALLKKIQGIGFEDAYAVTN
jgi:cell division septation protein DedD